MYNFACDPSRSYIISDIENPTFYEVLAKYFEDAYKENRHFALNASFLNQLTLAQLDKIATLHPNIKDDKFFIGSYFQK